MLKIAILDCNTFTLRKLPAMVPHCDFYRLAFPQSPESQAVAQKRPGEDRGRKNHRLQPISGRDHGLGRNLRQREDWLVFIERHVQIHAASYQKRVLHVPALRSRWIRTSTRLGASE